MDRMDTGNVIAAILIIALIFKYTWVGLVINSNHAPFVNANTGFPAILNRCPSRFDFAGVMQFLARGNHFH